MLPEPRRSRGKLAPYSSSAQEQIREWRTYFLGPLPWPRPWISQAWWPLLSCVLRRGEGVQASEKRCGGVEKQVGACGMRSQSRGVRPACRFPFELRSLVTATIPTNNTAFQQGAFLQAEGILHTTPRLHCERSEDRRLGAGPPKIRPGATCTCYSGFHYDLYRIFYVDSLRGFPAKKSTVRRGTCL